MRPLTQSELKAVAEQTTVSPADVRLTGSDLLRFGMTSRGIRNNNPGNIRHGADWQGLADKQTDPSFCTFTDPAWGIRAMCKIFLSYRRTGVDTVREIISRWAPPHENNTEAYIEAVDHQIGVKANDLIDVRHARTMLGLVKAVIQHENGVQPYTDETLLAGLDLAGITA